MPFDRAQEELEYEFNARYDYLREAYGDMVESEESLRHEAEANEAEWQAEQDAFIGPRRPNAPQVTTDDFIPF
jgi:hypothetical protein